MCVYIWTITQPLKTWNNPACSKMDEPRDCHTEWSKSDREREISYEVSYMHNLKRNDTNQLIYKTERLIDIENKLMVTKGEVSRGRDK